MALCGCAVRVRTQHPFEVRIPAGFKINTSAEPPQQFAAADYRLEGKGTFRRIVVSHKGIISYDVWRATPKGELKHLSFALTSPSGQPLESADYAAARDGDECGTVGLFLYRSDAVTYEDIIALRDRAFQVPFSSGGRPLSELDFAQDGAEVAKLRKQVSVPHFYSDLRPIDRKRLSLAVPKC